MTDDMLKDDELAESYVSVLFPSIPTRMYNLATIARMKRNFCETLTKLAKLRPDVLWSNGEINEAQLAKATRIRQPTIHRMLKGETNEPRGENAKKLCNYFKVTRDQLVGDRPIPALDGGESPVDENVAPYEVQGGRIPLISWVQAGAWTESPDTFEPGDAEEWITPVFKHGPNAFCLEHRGLSMWPDYRPGEIIQVDPSVEALNGSDVVVRTPDGKHTFKRLQITEEGDYLLAVNEDWPDRIIKIPEGSVICGVVTGSWMRRR